MSKNSSYCENEPFVSKMKQVDTKSKLKQITYKKNFIIKPGSRDYAWKRIEVKNEKFIFIPQLFSIHFIMRQKKVSVFVAWIFL